MAARRAPAGGLTSDDVAKLRTQLEAGRRPRVQLSGLQFTEDTSGTVSRIGNPDVDGTDFVTVRVKVNGVTDELAFAPAELGLGRGPRSGASAGARRGRAANASAARSANGTADNDRAEQGILTGSVSEPAGAAAESTGPVSAPTAAAAKPAGKTAPAEPKPPSGAAAGSAAKRRKPAAAKVSFTISSTGATWALTASRGAKGIAKSVPIAPGVVTGVAELLDQPALLEAVAEINETAWAEAQVRAEQLRAELDELEAVLAAHRFPR